MVDRESIENYRSPQPSVESVDGHRLTLYCADDLPDIGHAVAVVGPDDQRLWTVVERHAGGRRVEAWTPTSPQWLTPRCPIELAGRPAGFDFDPSEPLRPDAEMIRPLGDDDDAVPLWPKAPQWTELDPRRPALSLGIDTVDILAPIAAGGVNLIVDTTPDAQALSHIARRVVDASSLTTTLVTARHPVVDDAPCPIWRIEVGARHHTHIAALQCTIAVAPRLRRDDTSLAIVELPAIASPNSPASTTGQTPAVSAGVADIVDRLGQHLTSTKTGRLTTLLHLPVPAESSGLDTIISTLSLGDVDTTIHVDANGCFDPEHSHSGADVDDATRARRRQLFQTLDLASRAGDKRAIFGDVELTDAERRALQTIDELRPRLATP